MKTEMKMKTSRNSGFTLVEIMLVVSIIGTLTALSVPNLIKARGTAQKNGCISNLQQIDAAKQQWALEHNKPSTAVPVQSDIDSYLSRSGTADNVVCPAAGRGGTFSDSYTINSLTNTPACKIVPTGPSAHVLPN